MKFFLAKQDPIEFTEDKAKGAKGKIGSVTMHYQCNQEYDGYDKRLATALEKLLNSYQGESGIRVAVQLKGSDNDCKAQLQLLEEKSSFLMDVNSLPDIESVQVKVKLSKPPKSSTDILVSKEMVVGASTQNTCEDMEIHFKDKSSSKIFKKSGKVSVGISIEVTVNSSLNKG